MMMITNKEHTHAWGFNMGVVDEIKKKFEAKKALDRFKQKLATCKRTEDFIKAFAQYQGVEDFEYEHYRNKMIESLQKAGLYKKRISKDLFLQYIQKRFLKNKKEGRNDEQNN